MDHQDHVSLLRAGVAMAGPRWLELGAGDGAFTLALADLLGDGGDITALDRDQRSLDRLEPRIRERFGGTGITRLAADFTRALPAGHFDGVLAANSLHFVADPLPILERIRDRLSPGGRLVVVEYDADRGNHWVPYPISFARWTDLATAAGFVVPRLTHRVPSRFLASIYGAVTVARDAGQKVPEGKTAKNRVHLDLGVSGGHGVELEERRRLVDAEVERLKALGATDARGVLELRGEYWVRMNDPEGNEFCVQ